MGANTAQHVQLTIQDEQDLLQFFGAGAAHFERSTMGGIIAHLDSSSQGSRPCPHCNDGITGPTPEQHAVRLLQVALQRLTGDGEVRNVVRHDPTWGRVCNACGGTGQAEIGFGRYTCPDCLNGDPKRATCETCSGAGTVPRQLVCPECRNQRAERVGCSHCCGTGHVAPTVRPTGGSLKGGAVFSHGAMLGRARVSRKVDRLGDLRQVFAAYFGAAGDRWSAGRGRIVAVYPLTRAGQQLLKRARAKLTKTEGLSNDQILSEEIDLAKGQGDATRSKLVELAEQEAYTLMAAATALYQGKGLPGAEKSGAAA